MPTIRIHGTELNYTDRDIITFDEGMIGMPHLRRMVLVNQNDIAPFLWLASLDDPEVAFLVLEPSGYFADYAPPIPADTHRRINLAGEERPLVLLLVTLLAAWQQSTINLRAPIVIAPQAMRGVQMILTGSPYSLTEPLPLAA